jgi:hypothetical protein
MVVEARLLDSAGRRRSERDPAVFSVRPPGEQRHAVDRMPRRDEGGLPGAERPAGDHGLRPVRRGLRAAGVKELRPTLFGLGRRQVLEQLGQPVSMLFARSTLTMVDGSFSGSLPVRISVRAVSFL